MIEVYKYIERSLKMPVYYYAAAVIIGLLIGIWRKNWRIGILAGYMIILFSSMVLNRRTAADMLTRLEPFTTFRSFPKLSSETWVNIISFIPIGLLCGKRWRGILVGIGFSFFIETTQLITHRGFFQTDDIINNTLGTIIGIGLMQLLLFKYKKDNDR